MTGDVGDRFAEIAAVADAVLYEGYLLYPYRASAQKNRVRWQWGVLVPTAHGEQSGGTAWGADSGETAHLRVQVLVEPRGDDATLRARVRFLRLERRALTDVDGHPVDTLEVGDVRHLAFDEGVPEQEDVSLTVAELRAGATVPIERRADRSVEELRHPDGTPAGRIVRTRERLTAHVRLGAEEIPGPYATLRLTLEVRNGTPVAGGASRAEALRGALIGTHAMLAVVPGSFVSPTDPPEWAAALVADCAGEHAWPSLAGREDRSDLLLVSPIIVGDHARIAPESGINLFDGTENDEILTLRTLVLTDAEKAEARATDPRAKEIIDAVDALPPEMLDRLHGAIRSLSEPAERTSVPRGPDGRSDRVDARSAAAALDGVPTFRTPADDPGTGPALVPPGSDCPGAAPPDATPWWDPGADASVDPSTDSVPVGGVAVARGSAVVLRPGPDSGSGAGTGTGSVPGGSAGGTRMRSDAQDAFLSGMRATVQAVVHDVDGGIHVAVSVDDDPAADLQHAHGRFRWFRPDELEPVR